VVQKNSQICFYLEDISCLDQSESLHSFHRKWKKIQKNLCPDQTTVNPLFSAQFWSSQNRCVLFILHSHNGHLPIAVIFTIDFCGCYWEVLLYFKDSELYLSYNTSSKYNINLEKTCLTKNCWNYTRWFTKSDLVPLFLQHKLLLSHRILRSFSIWIKFCDHSNPISEKWNNSIKIIIFL
jgi:hypothetical protein